MTKASKDSPFADLKQLKGSLRSYDGRPAAPVVRPSTPEDDIDFATAMRGTTRIADTRQAEIERPKPPPLPRPPDPTPVLEPEATRKAAQLAPDSDAAAFALAMEGVRQLEDSGRVDPALLNARRARLQAGAIPGDTTAPLAAWLDAAPQPDDPGALFLHAVGPAAPLKDTGRAEIPAAAPAPLPRQREADDQEVLRESIDAESISFEDRLEMGDEPAFLRTGLPRRVLTDLRRGRWVVQAELDLHGMTRDEARSALSHFLALRLARGERCVRVIHGKGLRSPGKIGVLKQLSRNWLTQREEILAFCQARPHDGGDGAVLVLLRAPRNESNPS